MTKSNKTNDISYNKDYLQSVFDINRPDKIEMDIFVEENTAVFAANEALRRHVNELFDNLKPSQRRVLLSMYGLGLTPNKDYSKSTQVVGDALKKYHPHSDTSVYEAMMFMAQPWRLNQTFVESCSNIGSVYDSKAYAGARYTDVRMSEFAYDAFFKEWNPPKDFSNDRITDYSESFSGYPEPQILVSKYPIFLLNWNKGYCTGRYTCTPGFRVKDACETIKKLIDNPECQIDIYPEDPRGCDIINKSEIKGMFDRDYTTIKVRGCIDIEQHGNKTFLVIKTVPFEVTPASIEAQVISAFSKGKLPELEDIGDATSNNPDSANKKCRLEISLKKGANPYAVIEKIYKTTHMASTFSTAYGFVNDMTSVNYTPRIACLEWIRIRREFVRRILQKRKTETARKIHLLKGYIRIVDENLYDVLIQTIKNNTEEKAADMIINKLGFTLYQTSKIMQFRLKGFSKDNMQKYKQELSELLVEYDEIISVLMCKHKIDDIIKKDMDECISKYDSPRLSKVYDLVLSKYEAADTEHTLIFTNSYIKKSPYSPAGYKVGRVESSDKVKNIDVINNRNSIIIMNNMGKSFTVKVDDISETASQSSGVSLSNLKVTDKYVGHVTLDKLECDKLVIVTANGFISRIPISDLDTSSGKAIAMRVSSGDEVVGIAPVSDKYSDVIVYTSKGRGLLFSIDSITETAKGSKGVSAAKLEDEKIIGISAIPNGARLLAVVTDRGYIKSCKIKSLPSMKRGEKCIEFNSSNGNISTITPASIATSSINVLTTEGIALVDVETIKSSSRLGPNTRVLELPATSYVITALPSDTVKETF